jgi:hypothetical protein
VEGSNVSEATQVTQAWVQVGVVTAQAMADLWVQRTTAFANAWRSAVQQTA